MTNYIMAASKGELIKIKTHSILEEAVTQLVLTVYNNPAPDIQDAGIYTLNGVKVYSYPYDLAQEFKDREETAEALLAILLADPKSFERLDLLAKLSDYKTIGPDNNNALTIDELRSKYTLFSSLFNEGSLEKEALYTQEKLAKVSFQMNHVKHSLEDAINVIDDPTLEHHEVKFTLKHNLSLLLKDLE